MKKLPVFLSKRSLCRQFPIKTRANTVKCGPNIGPQACIWPFGLVAQHMAHIVAFGQWAHLHWHYSGRGLTVGISGPFEHLQAIMSGIWHTRAVGLLFKRVLQQKTSDFGVDSGLNSGFAAGFILFSTQFGTHEQKHTTWQATPHHTYVTRAAAIFLIGAQELYFVFKHLFCYINLRIIFKITVCVITHKCMNFKNFARSCAAAILLIGAQEFISQLNLLIGRQK